MNEKLCLEMYELENIETPLSDMEWGLIGGGSFAAGVLIGIAIAT